MAYKIIMTDGTRTETIIKSANVWDETTPGVWSPDPSDLRKQAQSMRLIPSVFAGVNVRMQAMSDLPFTIYKMRGDAVVDNSDNYQNRIGFLPMPSLTFGLAEGSLVTYGSSYWYKGRGKMTGTVKELKYWQAESIIPKIDDTGEILFKRTTRIELFPSEEVLYIWLPDAAVELGPPIVYPFESAMIAAEANGSITTWVRDYMKRGAVKAMLLAVEGVPPKAEVERIENWFNRFMIGAKGLVWRVFNLSAVKPTIIGDGLEALKDLSINKELRYEIHTALGTRHLLEDENFATASSREQQFYTQTIVPDARLIQLSFNEQILHAMGYHLEFEPQRLEIFQVDQAKQAQVLSEVFGVLNQVTSAGVALQLASEILNIPFTEEQKKLLSAGIAERKANLPAPSYPAAPPEKVKALVELDKWEAKVKKAGKMVTWHALDLPPETVKSIKDEILTFDQARNELHNIPLDAAQVLEGIRLALEKE